MTMEKIIEIPDNRRVYFDLPSQIPAGKVRIAINILEYSRPDTQGGGALDVEAFSSEEEATEFAIQLSERLINEAWWNPDA
ncbi:MAG: hypothetical protein LBH70_01735 [Spirochaetaceae bacterium]|jgi:hypothetical protein|nr:hypothetical protein [Spirochaetaceae bacterium]